MWLYSKEENALKAKLRRLCEMKKDGRCNVPQWLHDEWKNGDHAELARQYAKCGFDKANSSNQLVSAKCPHKVIAFGVPTLPSLMNRSSILS